MADTTTTTTTKLETIPTPMKLQWRRIRYQVLPIAVFLVALGATVYLWKHHTVSPHGLGEVSAVSVKVSAALDGKLIPSDREYPRLYDRIEAGTIIGRIDTGRLLEQQEKLEEALNKKRGEYDAANSALEKNTDKSKADQLRSTVSSLRQEVREQEAEFQRVSKKLKDATLIVPVSGTVTAINHQPDEFVKEGQEIMTITQDTGGYIVTYVRPGAGTLPKKDQVVVVRQQEGLKTATARVQEVGTQVQLIPDHQLVNPKKPEWGVPVRIGLPLPGALPLRPGELVVLNYQPASN